METRHVSVRSELLEPIVDYLHGVDAKNRDMVSGVFHEDAETIYNSGAADEFSVSTRVQIVSQLFGIIDGFGPTIHALGNFSARESGGRGHVDSFVVANIVKNGSFTARGIHYSDMLERVGGRWLIRQRRHRPLWQTTGPVSQMLIP